MAVKTHYHIQKTQIPLTAEEAWGFLSNPAIFIHTSPPWLKIEVLKTSSDISIGSQCAFRVKNGILRGLWKTTITTLRPGFLIGCEIVSPANHKWMAWTKIIPGNSDFMCVLEDRIEYIPQPITGKTSRRIDRAIEQILFYKHQSLKKDFGLFKKLPTSQPQKVIVAGGTGLVGSHLTQLLKFRGHHVKILSRQKSESSIMWDPAKGMLDADALEGCDTIINLAGSPISCRWTGKNREKIQSSRQDAAHLLIKTINRLSQPPRQYIQASATGIYGYSNRAALDEQSAEGSGFLAETCQKWEAELKKLDTNKTKAVRIRLGVVLTPRGGALFKLLPIFKTGLGGRLSKGNQYFPWISINDVTRAILFALESPDIPDILNLCTSKPDTNAKLTKTLSKILAKPAIFPVPTLALKLIYGQMATEALLGGVNAKPEALIENGFSFGEDNLEEALKLVLGKK